MRNSRQYVFLFSVLLLMMPGCASKKEIPAEEIRERSDRAFDELRREESQKKGNPTEGKGDTIRPCAQCD